MDKIRSYFFAGVIGLLLGAGVVGGCWVYHAGRDAAANRSIIAAYQSTMADWQRRAAELDGQLTELRAATQHNTELTKQLNDAVAANIGAVTAARSDYERAIAQLQLARAVYNVLRSYYDPGYHQPTKSDQPPKP